MPIIQLSGCTPAPLAGYLKAVGILRLVAQQVDPSAMGFWSDACFWLDCSLGRDEVLDFLLQRYSPTPIVAPWNAGSGFYPKANAKASGATEAISASDHERFADYRDAIAACRAFPEVATAIEAQADPETRKADIVRRCRNELSDRAVEWLDAAIGIAADGAVTYPPILGTGGNEGRLDYTVNFMARLVGLLLRPAPSTPVKDLLSNALFGTPANGLQNEKVGQFDPGRTGGANQGPGTESETLTNPWDFVLAIEGGVVWASGIYRRQGARFRSFLCSPFTVRAMPIGYRSASAGDDARAEIWAPLWRRPVGFAELQLLMREGHAQSAGKPAANTLEFAEAAASLGVDRGIKFFSRFSLLKRRGDSYVALPAGVFPVGFNTQTDLLRKLRLTLDGFDAANKVAAPARGAEAAILAALRQSSPSNLLAATAAVGRHLRTQLSRPGCRLPHRNLDAAAWLVALQFEDRREVRIAAAIASIRQSDSRIHDNLFRDSPQFAWSGASLPDRMLTVLKRRVVAAQKTADLSDPLSAACQIEPGDATPFIEHALDDDLIEDLIFAFALFDWSSWHRVHYVADAVAPAFAVLKSAMMIAALADGEPPSHSAAIHLVNLLTARGADERGIVAAADFAIARLRVARLQPLRVEYSSGLDARRLAASLLIPVHASPHLTRDILNDDDTSERRRFS